MIALLSMLFYPLSLGYLLVARITRNTDLPAKTLLCFALSAPIGLGITSFIVFATYLVAPSNANSITTIILMVLIISLITLSAIKKTSAPSRAFRLNIFFNFFHLPPFEQIKIVLLLFSLLLFCFFMGKAVYHFGIMAVQDPTGGWDARYFWSLKAKFFTRIPSEWQAMFSENLAWAHPDYPLLIPGSIAWGWSFLGNENLFWPALMSLSFYLSLSLLLVWYIHFVKSFFWAFLAGALFFCMEPYLFWSIQQYADVPLAFYITASVFILVISQRLKSTALVSVSGLLAGLAAWTKNEGLLFAFWITALTALLGFTGVYRQKKWEIKNFAFFLAGIALPLVCVVILKGSLSQTGDYVGSGRSIGDYASSIFLSPQKSQMIWQGFLNYLPSFSLWKGFWHLLLLSCTVYIIRGFQTQKWPDSWILVITVFLINFGYFLTLHVTPHDIRWQIQTALMRLLLHSNILAVAFCFEVLAAPMVFFSEMLKPKTQMDCQ